MEDKRVVRISIAIASFCVVVSLVLFSIVADVLLMEVTNSEAVFLSELNELGWQPVRWSLLLDLIFPILYLVVMTVVGMAVASRRLRRLLQP